MIRRICLAVIIVFISTLPSFTQVIATGAMRDVMWKGELYGKIKLDTITPKKGLYGLGPVEGLSGEILIADGKIYASKVVADSVMKVEENASVSAPFFVHAYVHNWRMIEIPSNINNLKKLEEHLSEISKNQESPFVFRLEGEIQRANIHVVNLPPGSKVSSPDDAHRGQQNFEIKNKRSSAIGFHSRHHKGIFTHHDSNIHLHLITNDRKMMGHVDELMFSPANVEVWLSY